MPALLIGPRADPAYIIPDMSGMPAPAFSFSGASATIASVVRMFFAIDAAFWSAERVTMVGSMIPFLTRSSTSPVSTLRPSPGFVERAQDDGRAGLLVALERAGLRLHGVRCVQERDAAARHDALLECRAGGL